MKAASVFLASLLLVPFAEAEMNFSCISFESQKLADGTQESASQYFDVKFPGDKDTAYATTPSKFHSNVEFQAMVYAPSRHVYVSVLENAKEGSRRLATASSEYSQSGDAVAVESAVFRSQEGGDLQFISYRVYCRAQLQSEDLLSKKDFEDAFRSWQQDSIPLLNGTIRQ